MLKGIRHLIQYHKKGILLAGFLLLLIMTYMVYWNEQIINSPDVLSQKTSEAEMPSPATQGQHPPATGNESFVSDKSHFSFSSDKKYIAFVQNVFKEYNYNWDKYWALKIFEPGTKNEKTLVVDDTKMSSYEWLNEKTIRLYHSAGTGVRAYLDVSVDSETILFTKDYQDPNLWTPDEEYAEKVKSDAAAWRVYYGVP